MTKQKIEATDRFISAVILLRAKPYTAIELARALGVTKMTAHTLVRRIVDHGFQLAAEERRQGQRGPPARAYQIQAV